MNCPVCSTELAVAVRQGVEIDHCPRCRGVWLDRGELDKIIERLSYRGSSDWDWDDDDDRDDDRRKHYGSHSNEQYKPKKKEGFFGRLFDFD